MRTLTFRTTAYLTLLAIILAATAAAADNASVETIPGVSGWINWDRQVIKAVGHGILPGDCENEAQATLLARTAAIADAYRNLASVIEGVRVRGETYVRNFVTESDAVRLKVQGFVRGAQIVSEKQLPTRSYEIIMQAPLTGKNGLIARLEPQLLSESTGTTETDDTDPSGLIIDARGLSLKPSMSPKVYDEDGKEVYGTVQVSPNYAIESGIVVYPQSMDQALKSPRAGQRALVVKAMKTGPKFASDLIISRSDADRIREADRRTGILSRCRVSILIGPAAR